MAATLFALGVSILTIGFVWFWIARPILEDFGLIAPRESVNDYEVTPPVVMSRSENITPPSRPSSLQTDGAQTDRRATPGRAELLTLYTVMREAGISRDKARAALKAVGLPLDNNLWADAAPLEDEHRTPIVGRPTNAKFETDADYPYQRLT